MVSEKNIFLCFSYYKSMGANAPREMANLDPRDMIGRIYVGYLLTLLHTNIQALSLVVSEKKIFSYFPIISLW